MLLSGLKQCYPGNQHRATVLARLPGTQRGEHSQVCVFVEEEQHRKLNGFTLLHARSVHVHMCRCVETINRRPHRSHCCDPAPGAGRRSQAPLTGGSTISHSSADGPVYSATQRDTKWVSRRLKRSHAKINRHRSVWLRRHKLAFWQRTKPCRCTVYGSHRLMPRRTQRDQVN